MEQPAPARLELADGRILEYYAADAPDLVPLVFDNGTPGTGLPYPPFVAQAAERGLRLVSCSRPGYGASTRHPGRSVASVAADVRELLDHLRASRCYTMGWSGGGPHALATAALLQDRVLGAATVASLAPYDAEGLDWMAGMGAENVDEFGAALDGPEALQGFLEGEESWVAMVTAERVAEGLGDLASEVDREALTGELAEWNATALRASVASGIWGWLDDDLAFARPWGFDVGAIGVAVAVWQGGQDRMVPFAHGEWLAAHVGSARGRLLPEHGHLSLAVASVGRILDDLLGGTAA